MSLCRRDTTIDLGGAWSFAYIKDARRFSSIRELESSGLDILPCAVPGNFELDLHRNGIVGEPFHGMNIAGLTKYERRHIWYFRRFVAEDLPGRDMQLVFEGLDCFADIYLNGRLIGSTDNMLIEHVLDVNGLLSGENEILVHIRPAVVEAERFDYPDSVVALGDFRESLYVRKAPHMYGWDIAPRAVSAGIWRSVSVQFRPKERLETVFLENHRVDVHSADLVLHYTARIDEPCEISIDGSCGESIFSAESKAESDGTISLRLEKPKLWWVKGRGEPNLYDVTVTLTRNGQQLDQVRFTHGVKCVELLRTSVTDESGGGEFCFKLNGEKVFILGTNWVPADAYHSRDAERLPRMLEMVEDLGCNMLRCWGGNVYENDLFCDFCDRHGIMVWQDFTMACCLPPQDEDHQKRIAREVRSVVRRLRHHACLSLWSGDNEIDLCYAGRGRNPNENVLTRKVIPGVLREEDWVTPYIPSSPYMDEEGFKLGERFLPENHPWGPRDYYKSDYYTGVLCHFASEMGYHGCPDAESIRQFISPGKVWPYQDNEEWILHCTNPVPGVDHFSYRVELMAKQIEALFGVVPDNLDDFVFASQASQAEALKFFIETFRTGKWRRTGIIWWNLIDCWPQFSDAIVDYYFRKKLAYDVIKRLQQPLLLALREPKDGAQELVACNDTRERIALSYTITDADTSKILAEGTGTAAADAVTVLTRLPYSPSRQTLYLIEWNSTLGNSANHYLLGSPPFELHEYKKWLPIYL